MIERIFWNVDTQNDFMNSKGALYVMGAEIIRPNLAEITNYARATKQKVINTADWHNSRTEEISEEPDFIKTFPAHCIQNTYGAQFIPETNPVNPYVVDWQDEKMSPDLLAKNREIVVYKDKFDVFKGSPYANMIVNNFLKPKKAIVYGVATNVCVNDAVVGLAKRGVEVYVIKDAIKELPGLNLPYNKWEKLNVRFVKTKDILEGKL